MIPWFNINFPSIPFPIIGKLTIHAFGILVATGILVGLKLTKKRGRELGLVDERVDSMVTWSLVLGFLCAHFFEYLDIRAVKSADGERSVHCQFHVSGARSFHASSGNLLT